MLVTVVPAAGHESLEENFDHVGEVHDLNSQDEEPVITLGEKPILVKCSGTTAHYKRELLGLDIYK
jgi:hypothetical protein